MHFVSVASLGEDRILSNIKHCSIFKLCCAHVLTAVYPQLTVQVVESSSASLSPSLRGQPLSAPESSSCPLRGRRMERRGYIKKRMNSTIPGTQEAPPRSVTSTAVRAPSPRLRTAPLQHNLHTQMQHNT